MEYLSNSADNVKCSRIKTDSTGQNVNAIWYISSGSENMEQITESSNYGITWGTPLASIENFQEKLELPVGPVIDTGLSKKYAYGVWFDGAGNDYLAQYSDKVILRDGMYLEVFWKSYSTINILKNKYLNGIYWNAVTGAVSYRVYENSRSNLIYEGTNLQYFDQHMFIKQEKAYLITWLDREFVESNPAQIVIP